MRNSKLIKSLGASIGFVISLAAIYGLATASKSASPPSTIQVQMYSLQEGAGSIVLLGGTRAACNTPDNQSRYGCTAFYQPTDASTPAATVVPYPYGSTAAPQIAFESDYLKNVMAEEMSIDIAPVVALEAQAIAARSYGWNKNGDLNNSASRQVFIPYRYEFLRVEGGDNAHNPTTTPTPDVSNCGAITATGDTRYQRTVCDVLDSTEGKYITANGVQTPAFAEYSADADLETVAGGESYLQSVEDPISYAPEIPTIVALTGAHERGMSQNGAMRWGHGNSSRNGQATPWSVQWENPDQVLTHYYTDIDIRNSNGDVLTPPLRWNILQHDIPTTLEVEDGVFFELQVQNTGTTAWSNLYYGIYTRWCELNDTSCPDYDTSNDWDINGAFISDNQQASQVEPGEAIQTVYGYVVSDETGTRRLVIDACIYQGPMLAPRRPDESLQEWRERFKKWQESKRTERMDVEWDCFGHQSPAWTPYEMEITTE